MGERSELMPNREDGEFELILGNKQLLSVLFIVIVLLGVFFAMGFLAGRSTGPSASAAVQNKPQPQPIVLDSNGKASEAEPEPAAVKSEPQTKPPAGEPAATKVPEPPPAPVQEAPKKSAPPPEPKPTKVAEAPKPAPVSASAGGFVENPPAGTYLQAAATRRADAEVMLAYLSKGGLRGYVAPSPKSPELFRVLVGPLPSNEAVADARTKLEGLGIKTPYVIKY
jgi:cell division septation protein DedD